MIALWRSFPDVSRPIPKSPLRGSRLEGRSTICWPSTAGGGAVAVAMPRMQSELARKSEAGLLWLRNFIFSCDVMSVQYWESTKKLISYDWDGEHFPAWAAFNREPKDNSAVGI